MSTKKISDNDDIEIERGSKQAPTRSTLDKDDIAAEESFSSTGEVTPESAATSEEIGAEQLREMLTQAEEKYLRLAAEFENYKKRNARQFDELVQNAEAEVFRHFLEIFDNFKRALEQPENQKDFASF